MPKFKKEANFELLYIMATTAESDLSQKICEIESMDESSPAWITPEIIERLKLILKTCEKLTSSLNNDELSTSIDVSRSTLSLLNEPSAPSKQSNGSGSGLAFCL